MAKATRDYAEAYSLAAAQGDEKARGPKAQKHAAAWQSKAISLCIIQTDRVESRVNRIPLRPAPR
jgi:hypothetical protein